MNSKMTTNSQLSTNEPKKKKKQTLSKQLEQEQNHRHHMEDITWRFISGEGEGGMREKVQGIRSINGRYKIDRGR